MTMNVLWAKSDPYHSLLHHCIDAGQVAICAVRSSVFQKQARLLAQSAGLRDAEAVARWGAYVTALHDIGKCDRNFQSKDELLARAVRDVLGELAFTGAVPTGFRHEVRSGAWLKERLTSYWRWGRKPTLTVASAVRGHHGDFGAQPLYEEDVIRACWQPLRDALASELQEVFAPPDWSPTDFRDHGTVGTLLSGLVVLSDWIASNAELFPVSPSDTELDATAYAEVSRRRAAQAIARLGIDESLRFASNSRFSDIWRGQEFRPPRPLQLAVEELYRDSAGAGLAILEAPMGEGKTEAAVYLATQWMGRAGASGMYVALPTAATSNQMHGRIRRFIEQFHGGHARGVRLVHGAAWLVDDDTPAGDGVDNGYACEWFRPSKRALLAPFGVGTVDQALMAVLHVRFGFLRLFGLAGSVLVIDEVHAYDAYMSTILTQLLRWCSCLDIPVILLSATLPSERKRELVAAYCDRDVEEPAPQNDYPLITIAERTGSCCFAGQIATVCTKSISIRKHGCLGDAAAIAALAQQCVSDGGCVCVIANTVASAQSIYRHLEQTGIDADLLLFHSRFTARRRNQIEKRVLSLFGKVSPNRPTRAILIATQVVEQSLDLDFDVMMSEIAPIDLLLQRAGRLHRHDRPGRPTGPEARLLVMLPKDGTPVNFGPTGYVYDRFILLKTLSALRSRDRITIPDDMRQLIETVYDERDTAAGPHIAEAELREALQSLQTDREHAQADASRYLIPAPYDRSFKLALQQHVWEETEGEASSYFQARTRQGDSTRTVLLLNDDSFRDVLAQTRSPSRDVLKQLFLHQAQIPTWWLADAVPADGYEPPTTGPKWLRGLTIIRLVDGRWSGVVSGKAFEIREDHNLGIVREET